MKILLLFSMLLAMSSSLAAECDCTKWPWPKACNDACIGAIFSRATERQLIKIVKLSPDVVKTVVNTPNRKEYEKLTQFKRLSVRQQADIIRKFRKLKEADIKKLLLKRGDGRGKLE